MIGPVGALVSFAEGHERLRELAGVDVATKHVERPAEALGREIALDERQVVEPPAPDKPVAPTLYLGLDGTGVPMRPSALHTVQSLTSRVLAQPSDCWPGRPVDLERGDRAFP